MVTTLDLDCDVAVCHALQGRLSYALICGSRLCKSSPNVESIYPVLRKEFQYIKWMRVGTMHVGLNNLPKIA